MPESKPKVPQFAINYICSCLVFSKIRTSQDLFDNFGYLLAQINQNPEILKENYSIKDCVSILEEAINAYNCINDYAIKIHPTLIHYFEEVEESAHHYAVIPIKTNDDLSKVTKNYDKFSDSHHYKKTINEQILKILGHSPYMVCSQVIVGAGDTGTTLWLEKFRKFHGFAEEQIMQGRIPSVLMIAQDSGGWKHDYSLAQPHNILERSPKDSNPADYMSEEFYRTNPRANGRHVYQANQVNLAKTGAPLLQAEVVRIEKNDNHPHDWHRTTKYRLIVRTAQKRTILVYANEIDVCTGLGPAKSIFNPKLIDPDQYQQLTQFNPDKGFTPIVDGNQFILTDTEERSKKPRFIVIYGGGGTAAACYRKGFFGHDIRTESLPFSEEEQRNKMLWIAKQFDKAGTGKLATHALSGAKQRGELVLGELLQITPQMDGTLLLLFDLEGTVKRIFCDQFIYSIGQNDYKMRAVCAEIESDLSLNSDRDMVLGVHTSDQRINFFGAAAMAVREKEYMIATWKWLRSQNIGGDVGPGSMPPSRSQIKQFNGLHGIAPTSINANMDNSNFIIQFLHKSGAILSKAEGFVADLLVARAYSTSGCTLEMLQALLVKHQLQAIVEVQGHGQIIATSRSKIKEPRLLRWLSDERQTEDASAFVSEVTDTNNETDTNELTPVRVAIGHAGY